MEELAEIGIISGTASIDAKLLKDAKEIEVETPYGKPSDRITVGTFEGRRVAMLPRHGKNHTIPPHEINFRANIQALKQLGVKRIIATATVGSLKEEYRAGEVVIPDQFIDLSKNVHSMYGTGKFYHVSMADPFCSEMRKTLIETTKRLGIPLKETGTYVKIDGPQFSTRAASRMYRQFGDLIGMTSIPEAILARELEICFAVLATVTDYDCWAETPVTFDEIRRVMAQNIDNKKRIIQETIKSLPSERKCECRDALKGAEVN
jgi:5'-methylthioadenosine phosphorylase